VAKKKKYSYEDKKDIIDQELNKRQKKWFLNSLAWIDFDDVKQIIRVHLHNKWHLWDQSRPLAPWLNRIISNQLKNILRNYYGNFAKPCLNCPFNQSGVAEEDSVGLCGFTESKTQCNECPLYAKWEKSKKSAYNVKMPTALDNHSHEIKLPNHDLYLVDNAAKRLHAEMKKKLSEKNYQIYEMLFIKNMSDAEVAEKLGYKTTEKNRKAGYKQIKNLKTKLHQQAKKIIATKDIFYGED
jgi:DNA-directed RNA polymerase specialized sigma24 family protein